MAHHFSFWWLYFKSVPWFSVHDIACLPIRHPSLRMSALYMCLFVIFFWVFMLCNACFCSFFTLVSFFFPSFCSWSCSLFHVVDLLYPAPVFLCFFHWNLLSLFSPCINDLTPQRVTVFTRTVNLSWIQYTEKELGVGFSLKQLRK